MTKGADACFAVTAEADPQLLLRVLGFFAQRCLTPCEVTMTAAGGQMKIWIRLSDLGTTNAAIIAEKLRSNPLVQAVNLLLAEKTYADE